jgi:hypothetical protein
MWWCINYMYTCFIILKSPILHVHFLQNLPTMNILDPIFYRTLLYDFRKWTPRGHTLLGSHNSMVMALGSCVKCPLDNILEKSICQPSIILASLNLIESGEGVIAHHPMHKGLTPWGPGLTKHSRHHKLPFVWPHTNCEFMSFWI